MSNPLPITAEELIRQLDEQYPERCPSPTDSDRDVWIAVGARLLVRNLLSRLEEANDNIMVPNYVHDQAEDASPD